MSAPRRRKFGAPGGAAVAAARSIALGVALVAASPAMAAPDEVRELEWEELMPEDWDPLAELDALDGR